MGRGLEPLVEEGAGGRPAQLTAMSCVQPPSPTVPRASALVPRQLPHHTSLFIKHLCPRFPAPQGLCVLCPTPPALPLRVSRDGAQNRLCPALGVHGPAMRTQVWMGAKSTQPQQGNWKAPKGEQRSSHRQAHLSPVTGPDGGAADPPRQTEVYAAQQTSSRTRSSRSDA